MLSITNNTLSIWATCLLLIKNKNNNKQTNKQKKTLNSSCSVAGTKRSLSPHLLDGDFAGSRPHNIGVLPSHIELSSLQQHTENMAGVDTHTHGVDLYIRLYVLLGEL